MEGDRSFALVAGIASVVVVLDQATKASIVAWIGPPQSTSSFELIGDWLSLEYVENRGAAFGFFSGAGPLLFVAAAITLSVLTWQVMRSPRQPQLQLLAFGLILGGAVGNLVDRLRFGYVIDFISVGWWPNFNVADSAICIGVGLMLLGWLMPGQQAPSLRFRR